MEYIYIYSYKIAKDLINNQFIVADIKANPKNEQRTVFMFEENDETKVYLKQKWNVNIN